MAFVTPVVEHRLERENNTRDKGTEHNMIIMRFITEYFDMICIKAG